MRDTTASIFLYALQYLADGRRDEALSYLAKHGAKTLERLTDPSQRRLITWSALYVRDLAGEGEWQDVLYPVLEDYLYRQDLSVDGARRADAAAVMALSQAAKSTAPRAFAARAAARAWREHFDPRHEAAYAAAAVAATDDIERLVDFVIAVEARLRAQSDESTPVFVV